MRELGLVSAFFVVVALVSLGVATIAENDALESGWVLMCGVGAVAVLCELIYFGALFAALGRGGEVPERWYERSFEHHHLLSVPQKLLVLPFFYAGALLLVGALLLSLALAFAAVHALL